MPAFYTGSPHSPQADFHAVAIFLSEPGISSADSEPYSRYWRCVPLFRQFFTGKRRFDRQPVNALLLCFAALLPFLILVISAMGQQSRYRKFVYALSESTVYSYEQHSLRADMETDTVRVSGENAYDLYFLFTKKRAKQRLNPPNTPPDLTLDYGDGAVLECWRIKMNGRARRSYGIFWRFVSAQGDVWMYDTDDLDLSKLQRVVALKENEPWQ